MLLSLLWRIIVLLMVGVYSVHLFVTLIKMPTALSLLTVEYEFACVKGLGSFTRKVIVLKNYFSKILDKNFEKLNFCLLLRY